MEEDIRGIYERGRIFGVFRERSSRKRILGVDNRFRV
jgi:hypothetical protein